MQLLLGWTWPCPPLRCELQDGFIPGDDVRTTTLTVIPCIIVYESGAVGHTSNLVSIVPPTHDNRILWCVLAEPIICLPEIIDKM